MLFTVGGLVTAVLALGPAGASEGHPDDRHWTVWRVLEKDPFAERLEQYAEAQAREVSPRLRVPHAFQFTDRIIESGITYRHEIVDDAGRDLKMVHYDHGNGMTTADIDNDGLQDLYFVNQLGNNALWRNLGSGRFEDYTLKAGVSIPGRIGVSASFGDLDNDGDSDLYVTTVRGGNVLFENLGDGSFRERTSESGLGYVGHSSAASLFDYDNDGDLDVLLVNVGDYTTNRRGRGGYFIGRPDGFSGHLHADRAERSRIYENLGNLCFQDVSDDLGFNDASWSGDALIVDLNHDRYPDVYLLNMQGDDHYYENLRGRGFQERTDSLFPKTPWGAMGAIHLDHDNDGFLDIFVTDMHSDMVEEVGPEREHLKSKKNPNDSYLQGSYNNIWGNAFYANLGASRFIEQSNQLGVENYWPWGASAGDLNADGWEDLFVTASMNFPFRYGRNSLFLNNAGEGFLPAEFILGVEPRKNGETHTPWFRLDCLEADKAHQICQRRAPGRWEIWAALGSRSSVLLDIEGDGDLDIVTHDFNSSPQILVSDLADQGAASSLVIELRGTRSNRDGLGTSLRVQVGGRAIHKTYNGKSGYLSQGVFPTFVGLGDRDNADKITVTWPSGCTQVVPGPHMSGSRVSIEEECAPGS